MKDFYYFVKAIFIIVVTALIVLLYNDYRHDRAVKQSLKEQLMPELQKLIKK